MAFERYSTLTGEVEATAECVSWSLEFPDPIPLPAGASLRTLSDVRAYILALSEQEKKREDWQEASEYLLRAGNGRTAWAFFARAATCKAIYGSAETPRPRGPKASSRDRRTRSGIISNVGQSKSR